MRKFILPLCVIALLLSSCVGIESRLVVRPDGSGTLSLTYRISQMIADLGSAGGEKVPLPLPVTREDFQRGLEGVTGVELQSFSRSENEKDITIHAELSFNKLESLAQVAAFQDSAPVQIVSGGTHTITQLIAKTPAVEPTQDSLDMLDAFFSGYAISLIVVAPTPITSHSLGDLSADKKTLTYTSPVKDLATAKADVILKLSW